LMADQLVVIGRGRLIASGPIGDFIKTSRQNSVVVRTPQATELADLLRREGVTITTTEPGTLGVVGIDAVGIGDVAFENSIRIHGLVEKVATLEEAFLEATESSQEFAAHELIGELPGEPSGELPGEPGSEAVR